jgi:hypothetical protein
MAELECMEDRSWRRSRGWRTRRCRRKMIMLRWTALSNRRWWAWAAFNAAMRARTTPAFHQNDMDELPPSDKSRSHDATARAQPRLGRRLSLLAACNCACTRSLHRLRIIDRFGPAYGPERHTMASLSASTCWSERSVALFFLDKTINQVLVPTKGGRKRLT